MQIIGGKHRFQKLFVPKSPHIRPTSGYLRECLFNICQDAIENALFLDLFAGCGAMGLEALSRGAAKAVFVDNHSLSIRSIRQNIQKLNEKEHCQILHADIFDALDQLAKSKLSFDIIYADPPYHLDAHSLSLSDQVLVWMDAHPHILKTGGHLFLEDAKNNQAEGMALAHFILKSSRKIGVSHLRQYIQTP